MLRRLLTRVTNRIYSLPIIVLMPHSRCNCRCVMCDIWKANATKRELSEEDLKKHVHHFTKIGVRELVLSGGEALMHSNLWKLCDTLHQANVKITLLSTGLLLQKNAAEIVAHCDEVIISLDGSQPVHDKIRNVPRGFEKIVSGIQELKKLKRDFRITARCVLQRYNVTDFINTVNAAKEIGIAQISFLPADIYTTAFNHVEDLSDHRVSEIALSKEEVVSFRNIVKQSFEELKEEYDSNFIQESPARMMEVVQYYEAVNGLAKYPEKKCNAPWVSAVIESDGSVMPCFFHKSYGNIHEKDLMEILNSAEAVDFRKNLDVASDPLCKKCVCSLKLGLLQ